MKYIWIIILIFFFVSIYGLAPTVSVGDVSELVGSASNLGICHSPGYPLFSNIYKIGISLIFFGENGYKAGVISLVLYFFTGILIIFFIKNFVNQNIILLVFTILYFFSQKSLYNQALVGEVFSLHNFLVVLIIYILFSTKIEFNKKFYLTAFVLGLCFSQQYITVLILPGLIFWLIYEIIAKRNKVESSVVLISFLFFLLGLSIFLFIPLRSLSEPLYDWEDPQTLQRFFYLVTRGRYGSFSLAQGGKIKISIENIYNGIKMFIDIVEPYNIILLCIAIFVFFGSKEKIKEKFYQIIFFCLIFLFFSGPFFLSLTGIKTITVETKYILERLVIPSFVCLVIIVSLSFLFVKNKFFLIFLCLVNFYFMVKNFMNNFHRNDFFLYDYTTNIFRNLPYNSILFSDRADETEFSIAYFTRILKIRKDIQFIDCNASVTKSIYGDNYYKIWGEARLKIRSSVEKSIIEKTKNKVFYNTVLPLQTETKKYKFGLLYSTLEPAIVLPHEIFVIRNEPTKFVARAYSLYIVYLNLLAEYFLEVSKKYENMIDIAKKYYKKLFFISGESRYLGYIPYHYFSKNDYKKASEEYLKILNYPNIDEEDKIKFKLNLGVVYEYMGEYEKAQKCYYEILNIKSDFPEVYLNLGSLCWKIKKKDESIKWFSQYLKYKPYDEQIKKFVEHLQAK